MIKNEIKNDLKHILPCVIALGIMYFLMDYYYDTFCPVRMFTGFPCPGCGLTRAGIQMFLLNWKAAWKLNPTIFLWIPSILIGLFSRYFWKKGKKVVLPLLCLVSIITICCFIYRIKIYYPNVEPMNYHEHNVIMQLYSLKKF